MGKWRTYEWLVYNYYCYLNRNYTNDWKVTYDVNKYGHSGTLRQIDILMESQAQNIMKVIDCKCYKKAVNIKRVEEIIGMLDDLRANAGVIVSPKGFSDGAVRRAKEYGRLELITIGSKDLFPYRFYNNPRIDVKCPNCFGVENYFSKRKSNAIVNMSAYDIVYREDRESFSKVNVGFCDECMSTIFYCTECKQYISVPIDDIKKGIKKECKCKIQYSLYSYYDEFGNGNTAVSYLDSNGNELLSEDNISYMYNNYGIMLDGY